MRQIRSDFIHPELPQTVHVTSKCSRSLHLLVPDPAASPSEDGTVEHADRRKGLMMGRLEQLEEATSISVCGLARMDNHVHFLFKNEAQEPLDWSAEDVTLRWLMLRPQRG